MTSLHPGHRALLDAPGCLAHEERGAELWHLRDEVIDVDHARGVVVVERYALGGPAHEAPNAIRRMGGPQRRRLRPD
jgi:hypothetical protein